LVMAASPILSDSDQAKLKENKHEEIDMRVGFRALYRDFVEGSAKLQSYIEKEISINRFGNAALALHFLEAGILFTSQIPKAYRENDFDEKIRSAKAFVEKIKPQLDRPELQDLLAQIQKVAPLDEELVCVAP